MTINKPMTVNKPMKTKKRDTITISAKPIEIVEPDVQAKIQNETISLMLMKPMIVKVTGEITGTEYIFNGGGSIINVNKLDADKIMENDKPIPSCCGGYSSPYFSIV